MTTRPRKPVSATIGALTVPLLTTAALLIAPPALAAGAPWPGGGAVWTASVQNSLGTNMSGLSWERDASTSSDVLWAVKNGPGTLYKLVLDGTNWVPATGDGWDNGKLLHYPNGTGDVDSEGVVYTDFGMFVSSERNNASGGVSRPSVLRYDTPGSAIELTATTEWNLVGDLPVVGPNLGLEGITLVPDSYLVSRGFVDQTSGLPYDPADYPDHGAGLFFVGLEGDGGIYAFALKQSDGSDHRLVATIPSGFPSVMDVVYDPENRQVWAVCDDTCGGQFATLDIA